MALVTNCIAFLTRGFISSHFVSVCVN